MSNFEEWLIKSLSKLLHANRYQLMEWYKKFRDNKVPRWYRARTYFFRRTIPGWWYKIRHFHWPPEVVICQTNRHAVYTLWCSYAGETTDVRIVVGKTYLVESYDRGGDYIRLRNHQPNYALDNHVAHMFSIVKPYSWDWFRTICSYLFEGLRLGLKKRMMALQKKIGKKQEVRKTSSPTPWRRPVGCKRRYGCSNNNTSVCHGCSDFDYTAERKLADKLSKIFVQGIPYV